MTLFFQSYLFSFIFWSSFPFGALALLMIYQLTAGEWGDAIAPALIALTRTLYGTAVLFIPLGWGVESIYSWANPARILTTQLSPNITFLNPFAFRMRSVVYYVIFGLLSYFILRWSEKLLRDPEDQATRSKIKALAAAGLILFAFTISFASIDWLMSLEPTWSSTVFGMVYAAAQVLGALSFVLLILPTVNDNVSPKALNDLGNLLFAVIMFWAYVSFLQYLIIWSGNIPKESTWFNHRSRGGWQYLILIIALFQFSAPFLLLLFKKIKRNPRPLSLVALLILLVRVIDVLWFVMPSFYPKKVELFSQLITSFFAVGGVWCALFAWSLKMTKKNIELNHA